MPLSGGRRKGSYRKAQPLLLLVVGGLDLLTQTLFGSSLWSNKLKSSLIVDTHYVVIIYIVIASLFSL